MIRMYTSVVIPDRKKRVLNALNVHVSTGELSTHKSSTLCEKWKCVVEQNVRVLMKQECTKDWVRLLPWAVLGMNSQKSSSTRCTSHELFHGRRVACCFATPFLEDFNSLIGD